AGPACCRRGLSRAARAHGRPADADSRPHGPATRARRRGARTRAWGRRPARRRRDARARHDGRQGAGARSRAGRARAGRSPLRGASARRRPRRRLPLPGAAMSAVAGSRPVPSRSGALLALYGLLLRTQITVTRLLGIGALSALSILIGVFASFDDNPAQAAADTVSGYGLGVLVPLAALWFGTSAIGDLVEDKLVVYLWLKPVPRWQLPAAAILATVSIVVPLTALPLAASTLVAGAGEVV